MHTYLQYNYHTLQYSVDVAPPLLLFFFRSAVASHLFWGCPVLRHSHYAWLSDRELPHHAMQHVAIQYEYNTSRDHPTWYTYNTPSYFVISTSLCNAMLYDAAAHYNIWYYVLLSYLMVSHVAPFAGLHGARIVIHIQRHTTRFGTIMLQYASIRHNTVRYGTLLHTRSHHSEVEHDIVQYNALRCTTVCTPRVITLPGQYAHIAMQCGIIGQSSTQYIASPCGAMPPGTARRNALQYDPP